MSGNNNNKIVECTRLTNIEEDKQYESGVDSGFLSSGNLLSSCDLTPSASGLTPPPPSQQHHQQDHQEDNENNTKQSMRLDSGVDLCLSQLSSLSLKESGLNDLNKAKVVINKKTDNSDDDGVVIDDGDKGKIAWEKYYDQDEDGDTHLHIAIMQGFIEVALALIRIAPHPRLLDTLNDDAQSPLHLAVETGQSQIVRWLIVAGARPSPRNLFGDSPLHIAARTGDLLSCHAITDPVQQQERELLALSYPPTPYQQCALDQWNYDGQTSAHVAALNGHVDVLRHLVWNGVDVNVREGKEGYTPLHIAIARNDEMLAKFLLNECKMLNASTLTYAGRSALQLGLPIAQSLRDVLLIHGVPSPYTSDDEDEYDDDDEYNDELYHDASKDIYMNSMIINASA